MDWVSYWTGLTGHTIIFDLSSAWCYQRLARIVSFDARADILDYGAGSGFLTKHMSCHVRSVCVMEPSEILLAQAQDINSGTDNIAYCMIYDCNDPSGSLPAKKFDWVIVNSVLQYISKKDMVHILRTLSRVLKPSGKIIVSDIIPRRSCLFKDAIDMVVFFIRAQRFWSLCTYIGCETIKIPQRFRLPLATYYPHEIESLLASDFMIEPIENPTIFTQRQAFILTPRRSCMRDAC